MRLKIRCNRVCVNWEPGALDATNPPLIFSCFLQYTFPSTSDYESPPVSVWICFPSFVFPPRRAVKLGLLEVAAMGSGDPAAIGKESVIQNRSGCGS